MVLEVTRHHFLRAALEVGQSGENDTLPYDVEAAFIRDKSEELSQICFNLFHSIDSKSVQEAAAFLSGLTIGSERLLAPSGSHGFRITTKIHPFWNLYLNGLGLAIAEANEYIGVRGSIPIGWVVKPPLSSTERNHGGNTKKRLSKKEL